MERLQRQSRQLVSFENYIDANDMVPTDEADDDDFMLKMLEKNEVIDIVDDEPPIGIVASEDHEIGGNYDKKPRAMTAGAKRRIETTEETLRKLQRSSKAKDVHAAAAKSSAKPKAKQGKVQTPKQASPAVTKKATPKNKTTPKVSAGGTSTKATKSSAKRKLTTTTTAASRKTKSSMKQRGTNQSGGGTQKSPARKARDSGK